MPFLLAFIFRDHKLDKLIFPDSKTIACTLHCHRNTNKETFAAVCCLPSKQGFAKQVKATHASKHSLCVGNSYKKGSYNRRLNNDKVNGKF